MLQSKKENYRGVNQSLSIEQIVCTDCRAKYIRAKHIKYDRQTSFNTIGESETECAICNNHKYDMNDLNKDRLEFNKIIRATEEDSKTIKLRCRQVNEQVNDLWNIVAEIGKNDYNSFGRFQFLISKYAAECTRCGYIKMVNKEDIKHLDICVCNKCKQFLVNRANKKYQSVVNKLKPIIIDIEQSNSNNEEVIEQEETNIQEVNKVDASMVSKMRKSIESYHNNLELLAVYNDGDSRKATVCCKVCGTPKEVNIRRINELKEYQCPGCKEQGDNPNYLGLYKRDITNTTKNGLIVTKYYGDKVDLRCNWCGYTHYKKNKTAFLLGKLFCNKEPLCSSVEVMCPKCCYTNTLKNRDIQDSKIGQLLCEKCRTDLYLDARTDIIATDSSIEIKTGLKYFSGKVGKPVEFNKGIARTKDELYRGRSGCNYYNCRCTIHNQSCILNEDEMDISPHKYCNNIRSIFIDEVDFESVKLNRESSLADK